MIVGIDREGPKKVPIRRVIVVLQAENFVVLLLIEVSGVQVSTWYLLNI